MMMNEYMNALNRLWLRTIPGIWAVHSQDEERRDI